MDEADLCEKFMAAATEDGWTVYPEVSGWDIVLVDSMGAQFGIEAKLRPNCDVLVQALNQEFGRGPDFGGVLVPKCGRPFLHVAGKLGLYVFTLEHCGPYDERGWPSVRREIVWPSVEPRKTQGRLWLPPVVPTSVEAGRPAPSPLTMWRVGALRVCAILRSRGWVTSADFKTAGIAPGRWVQVGWIANSGERDGRLVKYVIKPWWNSDTNEAPTFPDVGWEDDRDAIAAQDAEQHGG